MASSEGASYRWEAFNRWCDEYAERNDGMKPKVEDVRRWHRENAEKVWPDSSERPSVFLAVSHNKGRRVRGHKTCEYYKRYRAGKAAEQQLAARLQPAALSGRRILAVTAAARKINTDCPRGSGGVEKRAAHDGTEDGPEHAGKRRRMRGHGPGSRRGRGSSGRRSSSDEDMSDDPSWGSGGDGAGSDDDEAQQLQHHGDEEAEEDGGYGYGGTGMESSFRSSLGLPGGHAPRGMGPRSQLQQQQHLHAGVHVTMIRRDLDGRTTQVQAQPGGGVAAAYGGSLAAPQDGCPLAGHYGNGCQGGMQAVDEGPEGGDDGGSGGWGQRGHPRMRVQRGGRGRPDEAEEAGVGNEAEETGEGEAGPGVSWQHSDRGIGWHPGVAPRQCRAPRSGFGGAGCRQQPRPAPHFSGYVETPVGAMPVYLVATRGTATAGGARGGGAARAAGRQAAAGGRLAAAGNGSAAGGGLMVSVPSSKDPLDLLAQAACEALASPRPGDEEEKEPRLEAEPDSELGADVEAGRVVAAQPPGRGLTGVPALAALGNGSGDGGCRSGASDDASGLSAGSGHGCGDGGGGGRTPVKVLGNGWLPGVVEQRAVLKLEHQQPQDQGQEVHLQPQHIDGAAVLWGRGCGAISEPGAEYPAGMMKKEEGGEEGGSAAPRASSECVSESTRQSGDVGVAAAEGPHGFATSVHAPGVKHHFTERETTSPSVAVQDVCQLAAAAPPSLLHPEGMKLAPTAPSPPLPSSCAGGPAAPGVPPRPESKAACAGKGAAATDCASSKLLAGLQQPLPGTSLDVAALQQHHQQQPSALPNVDAGLAMAGQTAAAAALPASISCPGLACQSANPCMDLELARLVSSGGAPGNTAGACGGVTLAAALLSAHPLSPHHLQQAPLLLPPGRPVLPLAAPLPDASGCPSLLAAIAAAAAAGGGVGASTAPSASVPILPLMTPSPSVTSAIPQPPPLFQALQAAGASAPCPAAIGLGLHPPMAGLLPAVAAPAAGMVPPVPLPPAPPVIGADATVALSLPASANGGTYLTNQLLPVMRLLQMQTGATMATMATPGSVAASVPAGGDAAAAAAAAALTASHAAACALPPSLLDVTGLVAGVAGAAATSPQLPHSLAALARPWQQSR